VFERTCFFLGQHDDLPRSLCESLEHLSYFLPAPGALSVERSGLPPLRGTAQPRGPTHLFDRCG
jgi:hypothetical protein